MRSSARLQGVNNAGLSYVVGGRPRELLIRPSAARMASYRISALDLSRAIQASNSSVLAGNLRPQRPGCARTGRTVHRGRAGLAEPGRRRMERPSGLHARRRRSHGRPRRVSGLRPLPPRPGLGSSQGRGRRGQPDRRSLHPTPPKYGAQPAVTIAVAKKHGTNNVWVAEDLLKRMGELKKEILPADVQVVVTRNYGVTANDKVKELEEGLLVAIAVVMALLAIGLGYRQALVVAIAVPCVFGLTLIVNYFLGFSINRISLFALTVALGLLVDDPIVDVENIHRHFKCGAKPRPRSFWKP